MWLVRKVTQYMPIDETTMSYHVSYDIDFSVVWSHRLEIINDQVILPLDPFVRRPVLAFDIQDANNKSLNLATRSESARITCYILLGFLKSFGVRMHRINKAELHYIFMLLRGETLDAEARNMLEQLQAASSEGKNLPLSSNTSCWKAWVLSEEFRYFFKNLIREYRLCINLKCSDWSGRALVKVSWKDTFTRAAARRFSLQRPPYRLLTKKDLPLSYMLKQLWTKLSLGSIRLAIVSIPVDDNVSLHSRIVIPESMRVESIQKSPMRETQKNNETYRDRRKKRREQRKKLSNSVQERVSGQYVTLYGKPCDIAGIDIILRLSTYRRIFIAPALIATLMSTALTLILYYGLKSAAKIPSQQAAYNLKTSFQIFDVTNDNSVQLEHLAASIGSVVSVVAVFPALVASYIALRDEHEYITSALGLRRAILAFVALSCVISAAAATVDMATAGIGKITIAATAITVMISFTTFLLFLYDTVRISVHFRAWLRLFKYIIEFAVILLLFRLWIILKNILDDDIFAGRADLYSTVELIWGQVIPW